MGKAMASARSANAKGKEQARPGSSREGVFGKAPRKALKVFKAAPVKRKYKPGEIAGWLRPPLGDGSADEGNDLDGWEEEEFRRLCLCKKAPVDMAFCKCGCLVYMTREEWHAKKEEVVEAPPPTAASLRKKVSRPEGWEEEVDGVKKLVCWCGEGFCDNHEDGNHSDVYEDE